MRDDRFPAGAYNLQPAWDAERSEQVCGTLTAVSKSDNNVAPVISRRLQGRTNKRVYIPA